jgi:hypothetical protein
MELAECPATTATKESWFVVVHRRHAACTMGKG